MIIVCMCVLAILISDAFVIPRYAYASVPTHKPLVTCIFLGDFECLKKNFLDPAGIAIAKSIIRQLRNSTINWILTGDFEIKKPFFATSFIADPQRIADNAARLFLSQLTGINFCNFHPNLRSIRGITININANNLLSCSGPNRPLDNSIGDLYLSTRGDYNFSQSLLTAASEKNKSVNRGVSAWLEDVRAGNGFLGQRDSKTGKIKTPGRLIAESLNTASLAGQIGVELVDEFNEALIEIVDTAIGVTIKKGLLK